MNQLMLAGRCTVLDFSRYISGPFATQLLADMGARVIKVEPIDGAPDRGVGPFRDDTSLYFSVFNRNKESIAVDLKRPQGRGLVERLMARCDVVVENFVPGVMDRYGLGHEHARAVNPRLVYASVSGFGQDGPMARTRAFDQTIQALSGIMNLTGFPGQPPVRAGVNVADYSGGMMAAVGILLALLRREWTGQGSHVDVSLLDCTLNLLDTAVLRHVLLGQNPERVGNSRPGVATSNAFEAKDGWVYIAALDPAQGARLQQMVGDPADEALRAWVAGRNAAEVVETLDRLGIPAAPVQDIPGLLKNPQLEHRGSLIRMDLPGLGQVPMAAAPFRLDGQASFRPEGHAPPPAIGQDAAAVLADLLGMPAEEVDLLERMRVIARPNPNGEPTHA